MSADDFICYLWACQYQTASIIASNWPMAPQISHSHWVHLCCLDCCRAFSSIYTFICTDIQTHMHVSFHNIHMQHTQTHTDKMRAHIHCLFMSTQTKCGILWQTFVFTSGAAGEEDETKGKTLWSQEAQTHTHTHSHIHTCCLLPVKAPNEVFLFH